MLEIGVWRGCQTRPPRRTTVVHLLTLVSTLGNSGRSTCVMLHQHSLFGSTYSSTSLWNTGCQWLRALGTAWLEVMDSVRGGLPPVTGAADTKAPPFWFNLRQLRRVIPGLELRTELAGDSVLASLCPIQPASLPYRCSSWLHSSINLLDAILFQNAIPGNPIKENLICV